MNDYVIAKYIRLSMDEAVSESNSIPHQRRLLDDHIEELDIPDVKIIEFVDNGYTGTNVERPGFQEMIELVRCGRVNCIVTKDFSRFARNEIESGYYIEQVFPLYRLRFISVIDGFDSVAYGAGSVDMAFKFLMHEYYSKDLSRKIKSAKRVLMQNGEHIVAGAVYGYRKNDKGRWEPESEAAEVVREIFDMALDGKTTAQIRDKLFADRRLAPREYEYLKKDKEITPKYNWTTRQIWRILTNEQYTGCYVAGKHESTRIGSKARVDNDRSEWIIIPDSHPPIVSKEEFERVQEIIKAPKEALSNGRQRSTHAKKLYDRIESGERKPASALYGYRINLCRELKVDDIAAEAVKMVFDMALHDYTARDIADELQKAGHLPPGEYFKLARGLNIQPTYKWPILRVREILKNEQYTGTYIAGRTFQDESGRKYHTPPSEWVIIPDKHPAIVSMEVFEQVQVLISQGKRKMQPHNYLLKGKIICGTCNRAMIYGNTTTQPMYRCMNTHADPTAACHKLKISTAEVENAVMNIIRKQAEVVLSSDDLSGFRKTSVGEQQTAVFEKQIKQLEKQRQQCYEQFVSLEINRDTFRSMKEEYTAQINKLANHLALIRQADRDNDANKKAAVLAKDALSDNATPKDIVNALIERVLVFPGNHLEIHWKFANFAENLA